MSLLQEVEIVVSAIAANVVIFVQCYLSQSIAEYEQNILNRNA